jgi:rare lipoprotein A
MGAASNVLPRGTKVTVVNPANGKSVTLTINDSGIKGRAIIDLSFDAFAALGGTKAQGIMTVRVEKP